MDRHQKKAGQFLALPVWTGKARNCPAFFSLLMSTGVLRMEGGAIIFVGTAISSIGGNNSPKDRLQVFVGQRELPYRTFGQLGTLLLAKTSAIDFVLPRSNDIQPHAGISFQAIYIHNECTAISLISHHRETLLH
jgi:hypothetical protein